MKRALFTVVILTFSLGSLLAQADSMVHDDQAYFPGGASAWIKHVKAYRLAPGQLSIEGKVWLSFIVKQDGSIDSVKVVRGITEKVDQNAISIMEKSPLWVPAKRGGEPVDSKVWLKIPYHSTMPNRKNH